MPSKKVKLHGLGVTKLHAYDIMRKGRKARREYEKTGVKTQCPYRVRTHRWSIWMTSYLYPDKSYDLIFVALQAAGVKVDV